MSEHPGANTAVDLTVLFAAIIDNAGGEIRVPYAEFEEMANRNNVAIGIESVGDDLRLFLAELERPDDSSGTD